MKENFVSINVIMDSSGSMCDLASDTIGGYNSFIEEQKSIPGEVVVTLCTFNNKCNMVYNCIPISEVPKLDKKEYYPCGCTALLDAVGETIDSVGKKLAGMKEEERPSKVLFLIITDGLENHSTHYTKNKIKEMIKHQEDKYSWTFAFTGANIDSFAEGSSMGIYTGNTLNYNASSIGTRRLYKDISECVTDYRSCTKSVSSKNFFDKTDVTNNSQDTNVTTGTEETNK